MKPLTLATVALFGIAALRFAMREGEGSDFRRPTLRAGDHVEESVTADATGTVEQVSDVARGQCRYVIVATSTCPYCRSLATRWTVTSLNDPNGAGLSDGWVAFWIADEAQPAGSALFDNAFPAPTFHSRSKGRLSQQIGALGVPYHLVIDRSGRIVSGGLGGELLPRRAYKADCTIDSDAQVTEFTPTR